MSCPPHRLQVNLKDITEFLTNELKSRTLTSSQLEERLVETTTQMEEQRAYYEAELARVKTDRDVQLAKVRRAFRGRLLSELFCVAFCLLRHRNPCFLAATAP